MIGKCSPDMNNILPVFNDYKSSLYKKVKSLNLEEHGIYR